MLCRAQSRYIHQLLTLLIHLRLHLLIQSFFRSCDYGSFVLPLTWIGCFAVIHTASPQVNTSLTSRFKFDTKEDETDNTAAQSSLNSGIIARHSQLARDPIFAPPLKAIKNTFASCKRAEVKKLIFTSTAHVFGPATPFYTHTHKQDNSMYTSHPPYMENQLSAALSPYVGTVDYSHLQVLLTIEELVDSLPLKTRFSIVSIHPSTLLGPLWESSKVAHAARLNDGDKGSDNDRYSNNREHKHHSLKPSPPHSPSLPLSSASSASPSSSSFMSSLHRENKYTNVNEMIWSMLTGQHWLIPPVYFTCVDVRDVARAHIAALESSIMGGRFILSNHGGIWCRDVLSVVQLVVRNNIERIHARLLHRYSQRRARRRQLAVLGGDEGASLSSRRKCFGFLCCSWVACCCRSQSKVSTPSTDVDNTNLNIRSENTSTLSQGNVRNGEEMKKDGLRIKKLLDVERNEGAEIQREETLLKAYKKVKSKLPYAHTTPQWMFSLQSYIDDDVLDYLRKDNTKRHPGFHGELICYELEFEYKHNNTLHRSIHDAVESLMRVRCDEVLFGSKEYSAGSTHDAAVTMRTSQKRREACIFSCMRSFRLILSAVFIFVFLSSLVQDLDGIKNILL